MSVTDAIVLAHERSAEPLGFGPVPRPLVPVANRPVLLHTLDRLRADRVRRVLLVVGDGTRDDVRAAVGDGTSLDLAVEYADAHSAVSFAEVLRSVGAFSEGRPFLVQRGDALLTQEIRPLGTRFEASGLDALAVRLTPSSMRPASENGRPAATALGLIGACFLRSGALGAADRGGTVRGETVELPGILARLRASGRRVEVERVDGCVPCASRDALLDANSRALERMHVETIDAELEESEIHGPVVIHPTARLERTVVRGPVVVGARTRLSHAYIGPYTSIGADVLIEASEAEYSIIFDGARLCHVGSRLESSIVGRNAVVGREFRVPNALRLVVADDAEVILA